VAVVAKVAKGMVAMEDRFQKHDGRKKSDEQVREISQCTRDAKDAIPHVRRHGIFLVAPVHLP
jgi:hypothetical protein